MTTLGINTMLFNMDSATLTLPAQAEEHMNKAPFSGVLTRLDEPSTRPPNGSSGHRVMISRAVAQGALKSLEGMPINYSDDLDGHDKKQIVGVIEKGRIEGRDLIVEGYLLEKNMPDEVAAIRQRKNQLGMSYEISSVEVKDTSAAVWELSSLVFTGAAILRKDKAAYQKTAITANAEETDMAVLDELKKQNAKLDALLAAKEDDEDDEEAARRDEEEARREDEDASRSLQAAKKARDDDDDEDAARKEEDAAAKFTKAFKARAKAMAKYEAAAKKARDEEDEDAAKKFEEDAARVKRDDEDAAKARKDEEAARRDDDEDAAARKAAARRDDDDDEDEDAATDRMAAAMVKALYMRDEDDEDAAKDPTSKGKSKNLALDEDLMGKALRKMFQSMTFPTGVTRAAKRGKQSAGLDQTTDRALLKRLLQQHDNKDGDQDASATRKLKRQVRDLQAAVELLTDTMTKATGLITDGSFPRALVTDARARGGNGGAYGAPARRTLQATGQEPAWGDKWSQSRGGSANGKMTTAQATQKMIAAGITDPQKQMAQLIELQAAGQLSD